MTYGSGLRNVLKRGALLTAANWPLVLVQFVADSVFKVLLAVPIVGGVLLVALVLGGEPADVTGGDLRRTLATVAEALAAHPGALGAFVTAFALVLAGGSAFMFFVKGGTVAVLADAEWAAGPIERPPLRLHVVGRASRYGIDPYLDGCFRLFRRYLLLGFALFVVYAASAGTYLASLVATYRMSSGLGSWLGWSMLAAVASGILIAWITLVNFVYLLIQMVIAVEDCRVGLAVAQVGRFVRARLAMVAGVFGIVLLLVLVATIASILASGGLGLIGFVPLVGLAVFPLQIVAWLIRGVVFQFLALTALGAYLAEYHRFRPDASSPGHDGTVAGADGSSSERRSDASPSKWTRTA